ncbi:MAG: DUF2513 domain-containing protein [Planctomycetia bacterium]|nr:DUF2513 domain-containing protein [Planctomycetia bacterium]
MDLVRKLVFAIEEYPNGFAPDKLEVEGYTEEQIGYHLSLMLEAGLINGSDITHMGCTSPQAMASSLTWAGHEFADAARSDTLWNQAKKTVKEKVGSVSIAILTEYLQTLAKSALGI